MNVAVSLPCGVDSTYAYDADGYLRTRATPNGVTAYTYDTRGALRSVSLPDGRLVEYTIDPLGRRIAKKIDGTVTEKYLWQGMTRLLAVYDGSDALKYRFQYAGGRLPVSVETEGQTYYLHYDQVGSLVALTDASGGILKRVTYDSFGNILTDTKPSFAVLGFAGGLYDADTGLVRFGYRDYDPETGRWTSKDPIGFDGGDTDLYGYCGGDPVNLVDPNGLYYVEIAGPIAIVISQVDSPLPGPMDLIAGGLIGVAWMADNLPKKPGGDKKPSACTAKQGGAAASGGAPAPPDPENEHYKKRREQAQSGDSHRQVGDPNRVISEGRKFYDTETGNTVYVKGNRVVITDSAGNPKTQFTNSRTNLQKRIQSGRWRPVP